MLVALWLIRTSAGLGLQLPGRFKMDGRQRNDVGKLTVLQLLAQLRVGQLWTTLTVAATILSGSFYLGYRIAFYQYEAKAAKAEVAVAISKGDAEARVARVEADAARRELELARRVAGSELEQLRLQNEIEQLKKTVEGLRGFETKASFLGLYVGYLLAKEKLQEEENEENRANLEREEEALEEFVVRRWERQQRAEPGHVDVRGISIGKGIEITSVKFLNDNTIWPLPAGLARIRALK
jgi:hypothetical protein